MRRPPIAVRSLIAALASAGLALVSGCADRSRWDRAEPETAGLQPAAFARWTQGVEDRATRALLVVRHGQLVHEWHASWRGDRSRYHAASIAKGAVGGLALALLAEAGHVELDAPAATYIPDWRNDPVRSQVTVRQLATHSSGLARAQRKNPEEWMTRFWQLGPDHAPMRVAVEETPFVFPPGRGFGYSQPGFAVLSVVIAAALRDSGEPTLPVFLRDRVFRPIGVADDEWTIGYGQPFEIGGLETWATWGGVEISADGLARLGLLLLRRGQWDGREVISPAAIEQMTADAGTPTDLDGAWPTAALGWWTNARGRWPRLPRDSFLAFGTGHKILLVVPSLDLVVVRLGHSLDPAAAEDDYWAPLEHHLFDPLMDAFEPAAVAAGP
jgi:CubicO group peptidase (beta-lactamase class C family)